MIIRFTRSKYQFFPEKLTLPDLKKNMPKKGTLRFFVKTVLEDLKNMILILPFYHYLRIKSL